MRTRFFLLALCLAALAAVWVLVTRARRAGASSGGRGRRAAPPSPDRVAIRTIALAAACARAHLEVAVSQERGVEREQADHYRLEILAWLRRERLTEHLSEREQTWLETPVGELAETATQDASWSADALAVLLWAQDLLPAPPARPGEVKTGDLMDKVPPVGAEIAPFVAAARVRHSGEIEAALSSARRLAARHPAAAWERVRALEWLAGIAPEWDAASAA